MPCGTNHCYYPLTKWDDPPSGVDLRYILPTIYLLIPLDGLHQNPQNPHHTSTTGGRAVGQLPRTWGSWSWNFWGNKMGGPPEAYSFRGCIPSYSHLQPWFFIGFAGVYNYLITKGGPRWLRSQNHLKNRRESNWIISPGVKRKRI